MEELPRESVASRIPSTLLAIASAIVTALSLAGVFVFGASQSFLDKIAGTWTALAVDLANGEFYRPIAGPNGFGGTRYFPLHFVLHAAAIKAHGDPVLSGQILALLSVSALVLGVYLLLHALGMPPLLAVLSATAVLASQSTQGALLSIKGDGLPAALNVLGVSLCARTVCSRQRALIAAGLFTLAFAAKSTSVYGVCAAALWFVGTRRARLAWTVLTATAIGAIGTIALMQVASGGRAFEVLWAASATGVRPSAFLRAPLAFAQNARQVPETLVFIQLGIAAAVASIVRDKSARSLPVIFFGVTLLFSVPIFAFEGTSTNHLIDIHAASVVAIAGYITSQRRSESSFAVAALAVAMLAGSMSLATRLASRDAAGRYGTLDQVLALIPDKQHPILAENPLVPVAAHQRPYMLDSFMFRTMRARRPELGDALMQALSRQAFAAVVLDRDPDSEPGRTLYRIAFFGDGFVETLNRYHERTGTVGQRNVFTPRGR